jgi:hypothetical protein
MQVAHLQVLSQVWVPVPSQVCVVDGAQTPVPVQVDQADHVPSLQERVCVPQFPHAWLVEPLGHWHTPPWQVDPVGQAWPHAPQFSASVWVWHTQAAHLQVLSQVWVPVVLQACVAFGAQTPPPVQADQVDQVPSLQVRVWVPVPQFPQLCVVAVELFASGGHWHLPPWQVDPVGQVWPHAPQLDASACSFTQPLGQLVNPVPHWQADQAQVWLQVSVPLVHPVVVPAAQAPSPLQADQADQVPFVHVRLWVPHFPQDWLVGPLHAQTLFVQVEPDGHTWPHLPQFALSLAVSEHVLPHV